MQFLSTIVAVICLTFSAITMAAPQGFISQEKCNNAGSYGCGGSNNIVCLRRSYLSFIPSWVFPSHRKMCPNRFSIGCLQHLWQVGHRRCLWQQPTLCYCWWPTSLRLRYVFNLMFPTLLNLLSHPLLKYARTLTIHSSDLKFEINIHHASTWLGRHNGWEISGSFRLLWSFLAHAIEGITRASFLLRDGDRERDSNGLLESKSIISSHTYSAVFACLDVMLPSDPLRWDTMSISFVKIWIIAWCKVDLEVRSNNYSDHLEHTLEMDYRSD